MSEKSIVIIGGGLAGATAAVEFRERGHRGTITIVAAEAHLPYERPPLSKGYLLGDDGRNTVFVKPAAWYEEHDVTLLEGVSAIAIETGEKSVLLSDQSSLHYDGLLIATGARPRLLDVPGAGADGIHSLRTIDESEDLKEALSGGGRRVVIIGASWIGLELAAAARGYDNDVTVIGHGEQPLEKALGAELGAHFRQVHERHGVAFQLPAEVLSFSVADDRVTAVVTDAGEFPADVVIVGAGVVPNTELALAAGLAVEDGIVVDERLRTSVPGVFAAGDVASVFNERLDEHVRAEHWASAIAGGRVAASNMLAQQAALDGVPYFFTDQFDIGMEFAGYSRLLPGSDVVYRGDPSSGEFIAFWLRDGRIVAGMNVNVWDVNDGIKALISGGELVDAAKLADPEVPLERVGA